MSSLGEEAKTSEAAGAGAGRSTTGESVAVADSRPAEAPKEPDTFKQAVDSLYQCECGWIYPSFRFVYEGPRQALSLATLACVVFECPSCSDLKRVTFNTKKMAEEAVPR